MGVNLPTISKGITYIYTAKSVDTVSKQIPDAGIPVNRPQPIMDRYIPSDTPCSFPATFCDKPAVSAYPSTPAITNTLPGMNSRAINAESQSHIQQDIMSEKSSLTQETHGCKTCNERKYKDGSNDPGVSFKYATHVSPDAAASAVMAHESQHIVREQIKAESEDRIVAMQYVRIHTAICPECGRIYVSGGTTTTATKGAPETACTGKPAYSSNTGSSHTMNIKV